MARLVRFWSSRIFAASILSLRCTGADSQDGSILLKDGFAFVDAIINGHGPFRMMIDTGTTTTVLAPAAARKAGLVYDHRVLLTSMGGEKPFPATSAGELQIGSTRATSLEIVAVPLGHVLKIDRRADGILGHNFLGRSAYLIDYARKKLWFGEDAMRRAGELPLILSVQQTNGRTILPVTLQAGRPSWRLTLDSGASNLIVRCNERCPLITDQRRDERVLALLGERSVLAGTLRRVEIAGAKMSFVHAVLIDTELSDGQDDGVIPSHWFSAVYVDGDSGLVRLAQRR